MRCLVGLASVALSGALACGAHAQEQEGQQGASQSEERVLAGPTVKESRMPGVEESFGGADRMYGMSERPTPMAVYRKAIEMLRSEDMSEQHRLSEEQEEQMRELAQVHTQAIRDLMKEHEAELAPLRKAAREQASAAGRDVAPRRGGTDAASKLQQRQAQIRRRGPNDLALQTKVWNVLTEGQQALVKAEIDIWRAKAAQDQMDRVTQRYLDQRRQAAQDTPIQRDRPAAAMQRLDISPQLRESIGKLEPEARRRLIERLRQRSIERRQDGPSQTGDAPPRGRGG